MTAADFILELARIGCNAGHREKRADDARADWISFNANDIAASLDTDSDDGLLKAARKIRDELRDSAKGK